MLRDNLVGLIVPRRSCGTQALGDEFSYLENPRPVGAESSLTGRCSSPFQTEPRHADKRLWELFVGSDRSVRSNCLYNSYRRHLLRGDGVKVRANA